MKLNNKQINLLKGLAHSKKPVVTIGNNGITESVLAEADSALSHHELIKVKLPGIEKSLRQKLAEDICGKCGANNIGLTGRTLILFRQNQQKPNQCLEIFADRMLVNREQSFLKIRIEPA